MTNLKSTNDATISSYRKRMRTYHYTSTNRAITELQKVACDPNSKFEVTIKQVSTFGIAISNGRSEVIMNIREHTKDAMKMRVRKYARGQEYHKSNPHYTSVTKAMAIIDNIICYNYPIYMDISQTSKTGILIKSFTTNNQVEFHIDVHTIKEIRKTINDLMIKEEEMR